MVAKTKTPTIFDLISALSEKRASTYEELTEIHPYDTFMVNRSMSLHEDTVVLASILNERSHIDKRFQALFWANSILPRKRWAKWPKQTKHDKLEVISAVYGMSKREAKLIADLHTDEEIEKFAKIVEGGGKVVRTN